MLFNTLPFLVMTLQCHWTETYGVPYNIHLTRSVFRGYLSHLSFCNGTTIGYTECKKGRAIKLPEFCTPAFLSLTQMVLIVDAAQDSASHSGYSHRMLQKKLHALPLGLKCGHAGDCGFSFFHRQKDILACVLRWGKSLIRKVRYSH